MIEKDMLIYKNESIKEILKKLDKTSKRVLLVVDKSTKLLGTITDGDIRRYILRGGSLEGNIRGIYNRKPTYLKRKEFSVDVAKNMFLKSKLELLPILDDNDKVVDFAIWDEVFSEDSAHAASAHSLNVPVVIMAGGKSTRLEPFTKIFPKPLIPIGDKPIVELVIDGFKKHGITRYYMILNYKGEMVESYFNNMQKDFQLKYVREKNFRGTAGGLKLLENHIDDVFIVSNCDVIVKADFQEVVNFHQEHNAMLTILSSFQYYKIPYGVVKFEKGGKVIDVLEKPEYTFMINAGVYILNKKVLRYIPKKAYFDMTDLIRILLKNNKKIVTYPVNESDYIDIGQWEEYKKALEKIRFLA